MEIGHEPSSKGLERLTWRIFSILLLGTWEKPQHAYLCKLCIVDFVEHFTKHFEYGTGFFKYHAMVSIMGKEPGIRVRQS